MSQFKSKINLFFHRIHEKIKAEELKLKAEFAKIKGEKLRKFSGSLCKISLLVEEVNGLSDEIGVLEKLIVSWFKSRAKEFAGD